MNRFDKLRKKFGSYEKVLIIDSNTSISKTDLKKIGNSKNVGLMAIENLRDYVDLSLTFNNQPSLNRRVLSIDNSDFSDQYRFWRSDRDIDGWSYLDKSNFFHLNSLIITCIYICYNIGINDVYLDSDVLKSVSEKFDQRVLFQFLSATLKSSLRLTVLGESNLNLPKSTKVLKNEYGVLEAIGVSDVQLSLSNFFKGKMSTDIESLFSNNHISSVFGETGSCAVVGNSKEILKEEYGFLIDNHDFIVRINNAPVEKYQKFVGSKTDFRFMNKTLLKEIDPSNQDYDGIIDESLIFDVQSDQMIINVAKNFVNGNELHFISDGFKDELNKFKNSYGINGLLSSGLKVVLLFNLLSENIGIFGFDFYSGGSSHYWEEEIIASKEKRGQNHDWEKEEEIIEILMKKDEFVFYD